MDWDKLRSFHAAAETGSLTAAGEKLRISQSAVSRQISSLEESVGVPLFQRHARGLVLTEAGQKLHKATTDMNHAAALAETVIRDAKDTPSGTLKVTAPVAFGASWLAPRLGRFAELYPDLHLNLMLDDREYDLLKLEAECAIRLWAADKAELVQRKLLSVETSLYASTGYIDRFGMPKTVADLDNHRIIVYGESISPMQEVNWAQTVGREHDAPRQASLTVNSVMGMLQACEAGLGVADLPDYMVGRQHKLVKVLPDLEGPSFELYFIYPGDIRRSSRLAAFRDFLTQEMASFKSERSA